MSSGAPPTPQQATPRPNAPHGATSRRNGLVADKSKLCRRDARRRRRDHEPARDRPIVQLRPGVFNFLQLAQTGRAEHAHRAVVDDFERVRAELPIELLPREGQWSLKREGAIHEPEVQIQPERRPLE